MGLIAQLNYFTTFVVTMCVLGITNGCIKLLAQARADRDSELERRVRSFAFGFPVIVGLFTTAAMIAAAPAISELLLGTRDHAFAISVAACSVPFAIAAGGFSISLQGHGQLTRLAGANAWNAIAGTVLVVVLVLQFGLDGAIAAVTLTSVVSLVIFLGRERKFLRGVSFLPEALLDRQVLRAVYAFGAASMVLSLLTIGTDLVTRTLIVQRLGISANGLYQPVIVLSSQFFLALTGAISLYLFPRLTELYSQRLSALASQELNSGVRLVLSPIVPAVIVIIAFGPVILSGAFSAEFQSADTPLSIHMIGDVLRSLGWTVGAIMLPLGLIRTWLWTGTATLVVQVVLSFALVGSLGLNGVAIAYAVSWAVNASLAIIVARRQSGFALEGSTIRHVVMALATCAGALVLVTTELPSARIGAGSLLLVWWAATLRRSTIETLLGTLGRRR